MKELFFKYLNECCLVSCKLYPQSIFHIYDIQVLRQKKLCRILNKNFGNNIIFKYKDIKDKIIFEQDYNNHTFYISYTNFWSKLNVKTHEDRCNMIKEWIKNITMFDKLLYVHYAKDFSGGVINDDVEFKCLNPITYLTPTLFGLKNKPDMKFRIL